MQGYGHKACQSSPAFSIAFSSVMFEFIVFDNILNAIITRLQFHGMAEPNIE